MDLKLFPNGVTLFSIFFPSLNFWGVFIYSSACSVCLPLPASKSRPGSTSDTPEKEKDNRTAVSSSSVSVAAGKSQDSAPTTQNKSDKEKKEKPSKKKDKSSKGAANLPPVESKPPPGPLVALGRRGDKPLKRPRSVESGVTHTHFPPSPSLVPVSQSTVLSRGSELSLSLCLLVCLYYCVHRSSTTERTLRVSVHTHNVYGDSYSSALHWCLLSSYSLKRLVYYDKLYSLLLALCWMKSMCIMSSSHEVHYVGSSLCAQGV